MAITINNKFILLSTFIFYSTYSFSASASTDLQVKVDIAKQTGAFSLGIGSEVNIGSTDPKISGSAIFLGKSILPDGAHAFQIYLNKQGRKVYYIDETSFITKSSNQQTVLNPYMQAGGTCTGYAIYDFLQQIHLSGFKGTNELAKRLSDEKGRTTLLVDNINEYYLTPSHRYSIKGILNKYGKNFGFSCQKYVEDTFEKAQDRILSQLKTGQPVMISFFIGPDMYRSPFSLIMYDQPNKPMDQRLWIPRKIGERNSGGHTIIAAAAFEHGNKNYLVTIDSDWSEPRVWDMEAFLNDRTALSEVEIITCHE